MSSQAKGFIFGVAVGFVAAKVWMDIQSKSGQ